MKVLLIKDFGGVGRRGEVKEVADGYALNYLIPNGFAVQATPEKIKAHAAETQKQTEAREKEQTALVAKIKSLEGKRIQISTRATEKGGLFKSIGVADIQKAIREQSQTDIPSEMIQLEKPIKEVGDREIEIKTAGATARLVLAIKKAD